ncbi:MAG: hypothetical protein IT371_19675 [Deltaproteobacteria bacterium]|nr:hypothetical protein [Deltaproteobacteria bacterium]
MRKRTLILISACAGSLALTVGLSRGEEPAPFTPAGQKWAALPTGHAPGKDNGKVTGDPKNALHFPGADCGICHLEGRSAGKFVFTVGGTLYKDKAGREPLAGAEVVLRDVTGKVISMTSNAAGNFFTYEPVAADPRLGGDPKSPANWRYKAWVHQGGHVVRTMVTLAPVGGMGAPRMSCNMHHAPTGTRGPVAPVSYGSLASFPKTGVSFRQHVLPVLKNRCKACHVPGSTKPNVAYGTENFDFSAGLDLSGYQKDALSAKGLADVVNTVTPDASLLLAKPMTGGKHGGGQHWKVGDPDHAVLRQWIAEGAKEN